MGPEAARRVLGLHAGATREEVERAFRRLARVHHPDRGGDSRRFVELVAARRLLLDRPTVYSGQRIVIHSPSWRRALRAVQRWRWRVRQPRPSARVR